MPLAVVLGRLYVRLCASCPLPAVDEDGHDWHTAWANAARRVVRRRGEARGLHWTEVDKAIADYRS